MYRKKYLFACFSLLWAAQVHAQQVGAQVWQQYNCASCHGDDAQSALSPEYPVLAGQHADYLEQALLAYQRGQKQEVGVANVRKNPVMGAMAANLSTAEIKQISQWLASLPGPLSHSR